MARPLSEDKRTAILEAATEVVAMLGVSAPTAKIAKVRRIPCRLSAFRTLCTGNRSCRFQEVFWGIFLAAGRVYASWPYSCI
jgi:hypothetical protein